MPTIAQIIDSYIDSKKLSRSLNTARAYRNAMNLFVDVLRAHDVDPATSPIDLLVEDAIDWFELTLKDYSAATERLYLTAAVNLYEYLIAQNLASPNMFRIKMLVRQRSRRTGQRLPQFPREKIEELLNKAKYLTSSSDEHSYLRDMRDRAFLLTLADTGLRVHEACKLKRGDIDWNEGKAIILGKGDSQAVIRFSSRSLEALRDYLAGRAHIDGTSGKPLTSLPLFARHDRGAGKKVKTITTATGRNIVNERVLQILGKEAVGTITPHSFRHYFVTTVLRASGNLKLAQELARHKNIAVTQRYAHLSNDELDAGYHYIFEK